MTRRRRLACLVLASVPFCTWSLVRLWPVVGDRAGTSDTLRAACSALQAATQSVIAAYEDELARLPVSHHQPPPKVTWRADGHHTQQIDICESLAGKRVTMIGGEHIYRLHVLLLQHRERAENKVFPCQYHEFCTHHHICLPYQHVRHPPPRSVKPPTARQLADTDSVAVNYIVSDTLHSSRNDSSWEYTLPFVDPTTGVRLRETYWLAAARKANVVILGRDPLSAPGQTYTGDWSFLRDLPRYLEEGVDADLLQKVPRSLEILNAAAHLTVTRFLPDLFQLLRSIRTEVRPSTRKRLIWPGSWYRLPGRGVARTVLLRSVSHVRPMFHIMSQCTLFQHYPLQSPVEHMLASHLSALLNADAMNITHLEDPWTFLFNAQVYLQNKVLRELLPLYGIVFLPLDVPFVAGQARHRGHIHGTDAYLERIGEAFLTRMYYVLRHPG